MTLPRLGERFAFAVTPAVEVLLWTLALEEGAACVVMTTTSGRSPLKAPRRALELQPLDHHAWHRPLLGYWVGQTPPAEVRSLGIVAPEPARVVHPKAWLALAHNSKAQAGRVLPLGQWAGLLREVRAQWRWDHERDAVLAEDARTEAQGAKALFAAVSAHGEQQARLARTGPQALARKRFFQAWRGVHPQALQREAEALVRSAVLDLKGATIPKATKRLIALVQGFNRLDQAHEHPFDTSDAEDIMDAVGALALSSGVSDDAFDEKIDAVREFGTRA